MKHDEFAFFNRQLAAMLRDGIPLEGALKQLSAGMRTGPLRAEVGALESDLNNGTPLAQAIEKRKLPDLYRRLVKVGVASNDLPGALTMLADHYDQLYSLWSRLKGLLVYPVLVLIVSLALTAFLGFSLTRFLHYFMPLVGSNAPAVAPFIWAPPLVFTALCAAAIAGFLIPTWRARLRWRLPGFREASLAQLASSIALMLRNGTPLADALAVAEGMESEGPAARPLSGWRKLTENGQGSPKSWPKPEKPFPPLFLWLVQTAGPDVAAGFAKAAEIYRARAAYRTELLLYGALPVSILFLGQMLLWQVVPLARGLVWMMNMLGDLSS